ncbi:uncharacterized protein LOC114537876 [Dendronephthya gigantea]|uniref:uncharacterized protein LOC114537876 n=1 Tax=Dendronephthya gigantea TaxID=151771 RepID=UPI001069B231|nr:uncharacterized protein LOC114537876 [Dendronephthya gigantea]
MLIKTNEQYYKKQCSLQIITFISYNMEDNVFEIEKILQSSVRKGLRYYRVRWKGFGEEEDTWEPEENLFDCKDVLDEFWNKIKKDKQTKSKVEKRKSESMPQCQTTKAKKKKDGRTTNNSTSARIDSSSLQSETIIIPETNDTTTVKQSKSKKKKIEIDQEDKSLDIHQEPKKVHKKRGRKPKNLSAKTELDKTSQPQGLIDENENLTNTNSENILPVDKTDPPLVIIDNEQESPPKECSTKKVILHKDSRENLGNKSVTKRGNLSSISSEPSPEYVPEYCDETLAYDDISVEEEFEFFGETGYHLKDSISPEKSGIGTQQSAAIAEGCKRDDTNSMKKNQVNLMNDEDHERSERDVRGDGQTHVKTHHHVKGGEDHVKDDHNYVKDDKDQDNNHMEDDDKDHTKKDEDYVKDNKDHVKDDKDHVRNDENHVKDDKDHVKDDKDHVKNDEDHMRNDKDHVKDNEDHVKDDGDHVKDNEDHVKDNKDHVKDNEDHVKDDKDHVKDDGDHVKDNEDHVKDNKDHVKDDKDHVKDDEDHVKDDKDHVKDDKDHVKDDEDHAKDDNDYEKVDKGRVNGDESHVKDDDDLVKEDDYVKNQKDNDERHTNDENHVEVDDDAVENVEKGSDNHVKDNKDHEMKHDGNQGEKFRDQIKDGEEEMEIDSGHERDKGDDAKNLYRDNHVEQLVKDGGDIDQDIIETASSAKEVGTEETQERQDDNEEDSDITSTGCLKLEQPLNGPTNNDKVEYIILDDSPCASSERDGELFDRDIDLVNSQQDNTTPALTSETVISVEKDTSVEPIAGDLPLGHLASAGESTDVGQTENVNHQRSTDLKLKLRSSSFSSTGLTDSECMSPEFVQLPEPKKGFFDLVFAAEIYDAKEDLTGEIKNKESKVKEDVSKDAECKTVVQEVCKDDLCHEPKKDDQQSDCVVMVEKIVEISKLKTCDEIKTIETKAVGIESKKNQEKLLETTEDKPVPKKDGENEENTSGSLSPTSQQRRLSDEETALCLLDLSCSKSGKAVEITEIKFQAPSQDIPKSTNIEDASEKDQKGVVETRVSCDSPVDLARNKDKKETNQQVSLKRKSNENKSKADKKRSKVLLNIPFMIQECDNEVIDLLQDMKESCVSPSEDSKDLKSQSSPAIDKRKTSATKPVVINERQKENVVSTSESSHFEIGLPLGKEIRSMPSVREQGVHHSEKKRHKTSTSSSHIKSKPLSAHKVEASSKNTSEKKHHRLLKKKVEGYETTKSKELKGQRTEGKSESRSVEEKSGKKHYIQPVTSSSFEKNKSEFVSSHRRLTKSQEGVSSSEAETKDSQHIPTTAMSSSVALSRCSSSSSDDPDIANARRKEKYDVNMQGINSLSWSNDSSKTYPYSAQLVRPLSLNQANPNLYPAGFNPVIVNHLNQKGFHPQASFPFTTTFNQPHPSNPSNLVNQKPFSAVAGLNWYPNNHPRPVRLITAPMFLSNQLYFVPAFSPTSQSSQQASYGRALQEIAKRKHTEDLDQPVSDTPSNSSIDTDKAWYTKDVGSPSKGNSLHDIKHPGGIIACVQSQINMQAREFIDQAESKVLSGVDRSNNIVVSITETKNDDFSPTVASEKSRASFPLQQSESCKVKNKEGSLTGKCRESSSNRRELDGNHRQGAITGETFENEQTKVNDGKYFVKESISLTEKYKEETHAGNRRTSSERKVAGGLSANTTNLSDYTVSRSATSHAIDNRIGIKRNTENSESIQKTLEEMKISKSTIDSNKTTLESIHDSLSAISAKPLHVKVSTSGISDQTVGIDMTKDQTVNPGKNNIALNSESSQESSLRETKSSSSESSKTITQFKDKKRDKDQGKINDKPSSKQKPFQEETRSSKSASENGKRCSKDRVRSRESPAKDQKERSKIASRSKEEDRRSRRDTKEKELKKQESDSEVEFDLDDYNPEEVITHKPEKIEITHSGITTAMSLREVKFAIKQGNTATVLASLAGGINVDSQDSVTGMTLLMRAVSFGQDNIVKLLLSHGANINIKDNTGSTPLITACEQGFENIVSLLLSVETDINAKQSMSGETALIKACMNGHYSVVAMLLAHGADCQIRSVTGLTASQLAVQCGHFEIRDLLESHNKKLQRCVETAISSCLCDSSKLMYPPLLPFVSLYPSEGQNFTYHFHCSDMLLSKTVLLFCLRAVFSRSGQVDLSFSKDNGVHTVLLNGSIQSPVLPSSKSVFVLEPKIDTNRLILQTYQSHVHLLVCIYAAEVEGNLALS